MGQGRRHVSKNMHATIPGDIVYSILRRLRVKTLLKFKSVCRLWCELISEPEFGHSHHEQHSKRRRISQEHDDPHLIIVPRDPYKDLTTTEIALYSYYACTKDSPACSTELWTKRFDDAERENLSRPHVSNGLVLLAHNEGRHLVVCNPATRASFTLPEGSPNRSPTHGRRVGFGFDASTKVYKVARFFYREYPDYKHPGPAGYGIGMEVFTLGATPPCWRVVEDPPFPLLHRGSVCIDSKVYWQIDRQHSSTRQGLLCFDLRDESYHLIPLPRSLDKRRFYLVELLELEGALCIAHKKVCRRGEDGARLDIWSYMSDGKVATSTSASSSHAWILSFSVDFTSFQPRIAMPVAVRRGRLLLQIDDWLAYYDPRTKSTKASASTAALLYYRPSPPRHCSYYVTFSCESMFQVICYEESLVPVPLHAGTNK